MAEIVIRGGVEPYEVKTGIGQVASGGVNLGTRRSIPYLKRPSKQGA